MSESLSVERAVFLVVLAVLKKEGYRDFQLRGLLHELQCFQSLCMSMLDGTNFNIAVFSVHFSSAPIRAPAAAASIRTDDEWMDAGRRR